MRVLDLALKDLSQMLRDRRSLLFVVAMPIVFTLFMGLAYRGSSGDSAADPRLALAVVDPEPAAPLNAMLAERLGASDAVRPVALSEPEALEALHQGDVAGVLLIPAGLTEAAAQGQTPRLTLVAEAASTTGQSLYQALRGPVSQLFSAVEIARISADAAANPSDYAPALELAWRKWGAHARLDLVRTEQAVAAPSDDWTGGNPYNQASPGILVQFAIFGLITSAQILVQERKTGTLQRLRTTALRPWEIVAGHLLAMFGLTFLQTILLVVFGQLALGVDYLREPLGTLLIAVALSLWVATLGLLIGVLAKEEQQVILFSMLAMFLFSALGGTWFPLETAGGAFAALGRLMPSAWAMNGLQNILIRGLDFSATLWPASLLLAYAAAFFGLAAWRFKFE
jgi:ABC-2 type transport system permease protein